MSENQMMRVLLIDDEEYICQDIARTLKREGYEVDYRQSVEQGLEYLSKAPETEIVLLDVNLGSGLNGIEGLKIIQERYPRITVIMHTGEKDPNIGTECIKNGAYDYLSKPFSKTLFLEMVRAALGKKEKSNEKESF